MLVQLLAQAYSHEIDRVYRVVEVLRLGAAGTWRAEGSILANHGRAWRVQPDSGPLCPCPEPLPRKMRRSVSLTRYQMHELETTPLTHNSTRCTVPEYSTECRVYKCTSAVLCLHLCTRHIESRDAAPARYSQRLQAPFGPEIHTDVTLVHSRQQLSLTSRRSIQEQKLPTEAQLFNFETTCYSSLETVSSLYR